MSISPELVTDLPQRPLGVSLLTVVDSIFLGVLPLLAAFTLLISQGTTTLNALNEWLFLFIYWYIPAEIFGMTICGWLGLIPSLGAFLIWWAATRTWEGKESGRTALIAFVVFLSPIQPLALALMRAYSHVNGGNYDPYGLGLIARFLLVVVLVASNLWYFSRPQIDYFYRAQSTHL